MQAYACTRNGAVGSIRVDASTRNTGRFTLKTDGRIIK